MSVSQNRKIAYLLILSEDDLKIPSTIAIDIKNLSQYPSTSVAYFIYARSNLWKQAAWWIFNGISWTVENAPIHFVFENVYKEEKGGLNME